MHVCMCVGVCTVGEQGSQISPDMSLSSEGVLRAERVQEEPDMVLTGVLETYHFHLRFH